MRTAIILLAGFVLWGICLGAAKLAGGGRASSPTIATVAEELPIFFVIFLVPVVVALIVRWRFL